MATINPARAVKWDKLLGSIEPGRLADLIVVDGQRDDPYEQLLEARETTVALVVIGGTPRVGQRRLMRRFWPDHDLVDVTGIDRYDIGRSTRYLYLSHDDDLLEGLPLSKAIDDLAEAMENLPKLAGEIDDGLVAPLTAEGTVAVAGGMAEARGPIWRVVTDFEEDDIEMALAAGEVNILAQPYRFWVTDPVQLDPITAVQDRNYLRRLAGAANLPEHIRDGLPELHGEA